MHIPLLQVNHLTIKLHMRGETHPVVNDLNFELKPGKTLAIVGESGCGKSMTALALMGILPQPPALTPLGEILYHGHNLLTLKESHMRRVRGKRIAMIFQDPISALNPVYTIGQQLLEVAETHLKLEAAAARDVVLRSMEDAKLPNAKSVMNLYPHQLSGGMLQRAMIAMALICSPEILIADEPTTALDVTIQTQILHLLQELQSQKGMAILLISHDIGVVSQCASEIMVMYGGSQIEYGPIETILNNPAHPYTQALLAARPDPHRPRRRLETIPGIVPRINEMPAGCPFHPRCKYAMELCKKEAIPFFPLKEKQHAVRCTLYDQDLDTKLSMANEEIT